MLYALSCVYRGWSSPILVTITNRMQVRRGVTGGPALACYLSKTSGAAFDTRKEVSKSSAQKARIGRRDTVLKTIQGLLSQDGETE